MGPAETVAGSRNDGDSPVKTQIGHGEPSFRAKSLAYELSASSAAASRVGTREIMWSFVQVLSGFDGADTAGRDSARRRATVRRGPRAAHRRGRRPRRLRPHR